MKKTFTVFVFLMVAVVSSQLHASDTSAVPDLVKAWGKELNKLVVWEAGNDYRGRMIQFDDIDASKPGALDRALASLNTALEKVDDVPLKFCFFDNALVVRRVNQPACDKPI